MLLFLKLHIDQHKDFNSEGTKEIQQRRILSLTFLYNKTEKKDKHKSDTSTTCSLQETSGQLCHAWLSNIR